MTMTFKFHPEEMHNLMPYEYHKLPLRVSMFSNISRRDGVSNNRKPDNSTKATFGKRFGALMKKGPRSSIVLYDIVSMTSPVT
jgi:hypothetical protein